MAILIFVILLLTIILAWIGSRQFAILFFILTMVLSTGWFLHHITTHLSLQL